MNLLCFALAWWLGLYLLGRSGVRAAVRCAGAALALYGVGMALAGISPFVADPTASISLAWLRTAIFVVAGLLWLVVARDAWTIAQASGRGVRLLLAVSFIFLALEVLALLSPVLPFPQEWLYWAFGFDLVLLGWLILGGDAFEQGESVLPHAIRSFDAAALGALVLGAQVALAAGLGGGWNLQMWVLLYGIIATVIGAVTLGGMIQAGLDQLAFGRLPTVRQERAKLLATADAVARIAPAHPLAAMDEAELVRHTRRALRTFGDIAQLATNPLIALPTVTVAVQRSGMGESDMERARIFQHHLRDTVEKLKPEAALFGTTPAWRHYNALYFPYIIGIKPYTTKVTVEEIEEPYREVWQWLRDQVPERTLHHWQSAATKIVAGIFATELHAPQTAESPQIGSVLQQNR